MLDDEDEKEELSEGEKLVKKKRDTKLYDLLRIRKKFEDQEMESKVAKVTLKTQKSLFPQWTLEIIQKEVIDELSTHCLESLVSFELDNIADSQLDFPISPRDILFRCFKKIEKAPISKYDVNHMLLSFYLKYGKPKFKTWSLHKIVAVKVYVPVPTENYINIKFKGFPGASRVEDEFTLADLPCINQYNWISLFLILSKMNKSMSRS